MDMQITKEAIYTFSIIFVELDLSKGLLDHILFMHNNQCWTQVLDFENMAFRCHLCLQIGHLQKSCPMAKEYPRKKKKPAKNPRGWKFQESKSDGEEDEEEMGNPINEKNQNPQAT